MVSTPSESARPMRLPASCRCGARWSGASTCHCGGCHETFTGYDAFDRHRSQDGEFGSCRHPAEVGLIDAGRGYPCWGSARTDSRWAL